MPPSSLPHGRTARRLEWPFLPPHLRAAIERRIGSPVAEAHSQTAGFTPGFASVLVGEDGSRHFVKAASTKAQRAFADAYREEARILAGLPDGVPAPRLRWVHDADDWVVLGLEHVEARAPRRPWTRSDLDASLAALATVATVLTPAPPLLRLAPLGEELADWPASWDRLRVGRPDLPRLEEAAALAARFAEVTAGSTLVHTDVRDDNLLLSPDGRALLCDWNWPALGAPWVDTVMLLVGARGDGVDVEAVLASQPTTRDVAAEDVDVLLALLAGYFLASGEDPVPATSPWLRVHQRWTGEAAWDWLAERRGWPRTPRA